MNQYRKVTFHTLGCKLNFSESSTLARQFIANGYARVDLEEGPDVFVLNTCSVTENADKKCKQLVRKALRSNPDVFVVIIGCYAQLKPEEISTIEGVDLVLGANEKFDLLEHVEHFDTTAGEGQVLASDIMHTKTFEPSYSQGDRTRSFLKVQDGCDYFCSFCTIPLARGTSRSNTIAQTLAVAREVAETEVREVVLTGVNIGDFGKGTDEDFLGLIRQLDHIEGIDRIRISSIEPNLLSDEIIEFVAASKRFVPHFHVPMQSGNDDLLRAMRRRYDVELYRNRMSRIKELMPHACIGADVIVGFPGETDEHFERTKLFIADLPLSYLHVFTYSERANTTAVRMDGIVPMEVRGTRSKMLRMMSDKLRRAFYAEHADSVRPALLENEDHDGMLHGFTDNYVKVSVPFDQELTNTIIDVSIGDKVQEGVVPSQVIVSQSV